MTQKSLNASNIFSYSKDHFELICVMLSHLESSPTDQSRFWMTFDDMTQSLTSENRCMPKTQPKSDISRSPMFKKMSLPSRSGSKTAARPFQSSKRFQLEPDF